MEDLFWLALLIWWKYYRKFKKFKHYRQPSFWSITSDKFYITVILDFNWLTFQAEQLSTKWNPYWMQNLSPNVLAVFKACYNFQGRIHVWSKSALAPTILRTFSLKWAEKIPLFPLCMMEIFVCTMTSSPCLREHHYTHTHTDVHTNCPRTLHADRYLTQYFWHSLTGNVKMLIIGLKMPCPSSQPMSLSRISNENMFSLVSYTMQRFSVSQTRAFCRRFIHCDPTKK